MLSEFQQKALKQNGQQPCDIVCGIRPQNLNVGGGQLSGVIEVAEALGSEIDIHVNCGGNDIVMVLQTVGLEADVSAGFY